MNSQHLLRPMTVGCLAALVAVGLPTAALAADAAYNPGDIYAQMQAAYGLAQELR